jgi:hypothetical protein
MPSRLDKTPYPIKYGCGRTLVLPAKGEGKMLRSKKDTLLKDEEPSILRVLNRKKRAVPMGRPEHIL